MKVFIRKHLGNIITVTGILHLVLGFFLNWNTATAMFRSGMVNTADQNAESLNCCCPYN